MILLFFKIKQISLILKSNLKISEEVSFDLKNLRQKNNNSHLSKSFWKKALRQALYGKKTSHKITSHILECHECLIKNSNTCKSGPRLLFF